MEYRCHCQCFVAFMMQKYEQGVAVDCGHVRDAMVCVCRFSGGGKQAIAMRVEVWDLDK